MTKQLLDARVRAISVRESGESVRPLPVSLSPAQCLVRVGVADRLEAAQTLLPADVSLRVVEGLRSAPVHLLHVARRAAQVCAARPGVGPRELDDLVARVVAPAALSPYLSGSAVSITLVDAEGMELDLGTPVGASPEATGGRIATAALEISALARAHRVLLGSVLGTVGLVNHPAAWWQWSWGDRWWAACTGAEAAVHGPVGAVRGTAAA